VLLRSRAGAQSHRGGWLCALLFGVGLFSSAQPAVAQDNQIAFDIPSQPLDDALDSFGVVTGLQVFYETAVTAGLKSNAVKGEYDTATALSILLRGSELQARVLAPSTITIEQADAGAPGLQEAKRASLPYYGSIQTSIMHALCQSPATRPGTYQIALQYWVDETGRVARSRLLASSGDAQRDAAIVRVVSSTVFNAQASKVPQPVTFAVVPTTGDASDVCAGVREAPPKVH
jgi:TonB family protein